MIGRIHPSVLLPLPLLLSLCTPVHAAAIDETIPDAQTLSQLEIRAQQANPRDQCFLYTELIHTMTEIAGRQLRSGNIEQAGIMLQQINHYAQLIHMDLAGNTKRLKNAEKLMEHTTYKLNAYLHQASAEDRSTVQATLTRLDQVHDELLAQVFLH
jgi:hypothetical protein